MTHELDKAFIAEFVDKMCGTNAKVSTDFGTESLEVEKFSVTVHQLAPGQVAVMLTQILEGPTEWLNGRSVDELGNFQEQLFSRNYEFWWTVRERVVAPEMQTRAVNALKRYLSFLDSFCDENGTNPAQGTNNLNHLDGAVYMTWDKGTLEGAAMFPGEAHLVEPILSAMEHMLTLGSCAMQLGGLHGLGHMAEDHEQRVQKSVDRYLAGHNVRMPWLIGYAGSARSGEVL